MRADLARLYQAGVYRARFSGRVENMSITRGHVALREVQTPIGPIPGHLWVQERQWGGSLPHPGDRIEILATISQYDRPNGSTEYSLNNVLVIE